MIKLINNSGRKIDLTPNLSIPANKSFEGDIEITPRINQMIQMGLLTKTTIDYKDSSNDNTNILTESAKRRKVIMDNIKAGFRKPSIPLDYEKNETKSSTTKNSRKRK